MASSPNRTEELDCSPEIGVVEQSERRQPLNWRRLGEGTPII